jgi:hypothetical protein
MRLGLFQGEEWIGGLNQQFLSFRIRFDPKVARFVIDVCALEANERPLCCYQHDVRDLTSSAVYVHVVAVTILTRI